jgi:hypothetical protein
MKNSSTAKAANANANIPDADVKLLQQVGLNDYVLLEDGAQKSPPGPIPRADSFTGFQKERCSRFFS